MKRLSNISTLVLFASVLTLFGCSKEEIVYPEENAPIFELHGTLGNDPIDMIIGDNNAVMMTSTKLENGVRVFTGEMTDGETSIEFGLFDGNIDKPNSIPQLELQNSFLQFARRYNDPLAILDMESIVPGGNATRVDWYINGAFAGSGQISIYEPGKYSVCARVTFVTGQTEQLCDEIILGYERNANCNIDLNVNQNNINAEIDSNGNPVQLVEWFLNDVFIGAGIGINQPLLQGVGNKLSARVLFANGTVRQKSCFIDGTDPTQWISDFSDFEYASNPSLSPQDYQSRLTIVNNGKTYQTIEADNSGSSLTLLSLEPYDINGNGNSTFKAVIQVEAVVMEMSTEKMLPVNFTTTIGLEVP